MEAVHLNVSERKPTIAVCLFRRGHLNDTDQLLLNVFVPKVYRLSLYLLEDKINIKQKILCFVYGAHVLKSESCFMSRVRVTGNT
jgi:hypothetical protein